MFANRFTALIDACALAGVLKRNLLLSLAEAEFFRVRWSAPILSETELAIRRMLADRVAPEEADAAAARAVTAMARAFKEAKVEGFESMLPACSGLPDPKDAHVLAAALKTRATVIVTDNLKDFPQAILEPLNLQARSADAFIADTIDLDPGRAVAAISRMRQRLKRPDRSAEQLLLDMEARGLVETVDVLRGHVRSI